MPDFLKPVDEKIFTLEELVHSDETSFKEDYDNHICELNGSILYPWKYEKYLTPADYRILYDHLIGNGPAPWKLFFTEGIETPFRLCTNPLNDKKEPYEEAPSSLQDALNYLMSPTDVIPLSELFINPEFIDAVEGYLNGYKSPNFVHSNLFDWAKYLTGREYQTLYMFLYVYPLRKLPINIYEDQADTMSLFGDQGFLLLPYSRDYVRTQKEIVCFVERCIECINCEIPMVAHYINFYPEMKIRVLNLLREKNTRDKRDNDMIKSIIDDYKNETNRIIAERLEIMMVKMFNDFYDW
jgi:hypothetical protein